MAQRKDETVVTSAESFPKVEKREMTTDRTRPMMPVFYFALSGEGMKKRHKLLDTPRLKKNIVAPIKLQSSKTN